MHRKFIDHEFISSLKGNLIIASQDKVLENATKMVSEKTQNLPYI